MSLRYNPALPAAVSALSVESKVDRMVNEIAQLRNTINEILLQKTSIASMVQAVSELTEHTNTKLSYINSLMENMLMNQLSTAHFSSVTYNMLTNGVLDTSPFTNTSIDVMDVVDLPLTDVFGTYVQSQLADIITNDSLSSFGYTSDRENAVAFLVECIQNNSGFRAGLTLQNKAAAPTDVNSIIENVVLILNGNFTSSLATISGIYMFPLALYIRCLLIKLFTPVYPGILNT